MTLKSWLINKKFKCQHIYHTHSHNDDVAYHVTELCLIQTVQCSAWFLASRIFKQYARSESLVQQQHHVWSSVFSLPLWMQLTLLRCTSKQMNKHPSLLHDTH